MTTLYVDNIAPNLQSRVSVPGHVIQVVQHTFNTPTETNTPDVWHNWGPSGAITPTSTDSKILVTYSGGGLAASCNSIGLKLLRDSTTVMARDRHIYHNDSAYAGVNWVFSYLDSPSTTSAVTYKVQINMQEAGSIRIAGSDSEYLINQDAAVMILMEIAG